MISLIIPPWLKSLLAFPGIGITLQKLKKQSNCSIDKQYQEKNKRNIEQGCSINFQNWMKYYQEKIYSVTKHIDPIWDEINELKRPKRILNEQHQDD